MIPRINAIFVGVNIFIYINTIIFNDNLQLLPWNAFVVWVEKNHGND